MICYIAAYLLASENVERFYPSSNLCSNSHCVLTSQMRLMSNNYFLTFKYFNIKLKLFGIKVTFNN